MVTESLKHKIYKASLGMVHGEIGKHIDLYKFLKSRNAIFQGEETQPTHKFIIEFKNYLKEVNYEPE